MGAYLVSFYCRAESTGINVFIANTLILATHVGAPACDQNGLTAPPPSGESPAGSCWYPSGVPFDTHGTSVGVHLRRLFLRSRRDMDGRQNDKMFSVGRKQGVRPGGPAQVGSSGFSVPLCGIQADTLPRRRPHAPFTLAYTVEQVTSGSVCSLSEPASPRSSRVYVSISKPARPAWYPVLPSHGSSVTAWVPFRKTHL